MPLAGGGEEPTATFCQKNYVNINEVKRKLKSTTAELGPPLIFRG